MRDPKPELLQRALGANRPNFAERSSGISTMSETIPDVENKPVDLAAFFQNLALLDWDLPKKATQKKKVIGFSEASSLFRFGEPLGIHILN